MDKLEAEMPTDLLASLLMERASVPSPARKADGLPAKIHAVMVLNPVDLRDAGYGLPVAFFSSVVRMTAPVAAPNRKPERYSTAHKGIAMSKSLNRLAANPWALSCASFLLTAILIRSDWINLF